MTKERNAFSLVPLPEEDLQCPFFSKVGERAESCTEKAFSVYLFN